MKMPIHPSSMTRWRNRIGEAGAEELLKETIGAGLKLKAVKAASAQACQCRHHRSGKRDSLSHRCQAV